MLAYYASCRYTSSQRIMKRFLASKAEAPIRLTFSADLLLILLLYIKSACRNIKLD